MKVIKPVAVDGVTVAVNFTDCPDFDGSALDDSAVELDRLATTSTTGHETLPSVLASPL